MTSRDPHSARTQLRRTGVAVVAVTALALAGCGLFDSGASQGGTDQSGPEGGDDTSGGHITVQVTNFPHIDPQSVTFGMWLVQMGLLEGLLLQTPDGTDLRPGVAEEWEVSEDGLVHTFQLREDAVWSNGEPVTADDFEWTYQRLLDPDRGPGGVTAEASSYQATLGILNATDYNTGSVEDFADVGIDALDERTLEFTLEAPNPGFVMGLTHPSMLPLNPDAVEGEGDWQQPENWVGNGPYNLTSWVPNSSMQLERNPQYWDAENAALDSIAVELLEPGAITTTVPYENEDVDIQALSNPANIARFMADPELSEHINLLENSATTYLAMLNSRNPLLEDPAIRTALSLGLGREQIAGISEISEPASTLVSPIVPDWDADLAAHEQMWGDEAVAEAQRLLAEAGYPDGEDFPTIHLLAGSDSNHLDVIIDTWESNLGISAVKDVLEVGVFVERRAELQDEDYVGYFYGSFSGISTWPTQVEQLWSTDFVRRITLDADGYAQYLQIEADPALNPAERSAQLEDILSSNSAPQAQAFAEAVESTRDTVDEAEQTRLLQAAATHREESQAVIPLVWDSTIVVAQPRVQGLELRAQSDRYYFKDLWVDEEAE